MKHVSKFFALGAAISFASASAAFSAEPPPLIGPTANNGSFESVTGKANFSAPASSTSSIPYWGATLVNTSGDTVEAPLDSGAQVGGNVVEKGNAGAFFQSGNVSTAFNLVTDRPIKKGDKFTLTWYGKGSGAVQVVTLFSQAATTVGTTYSYVPSATLATASGVDYALGDEFAKYTLTYTAKAEDAGKLIGITVGNSSGDSYFVADDFTLEKR